MKFFLLTSLFCVLIATLRAAESIGYFKNPYHPGKCVLYGKVLSPGDVEHMPGICGKMYCGRDGRVTFHSCGVGSRSKGKSRWTYPTCCDRAD